MMWIKRLFKPKESTVHIYGLGFQRVVNKEQKALANKIIARTDERLKKIGAR